MAAVQYFTSAASWIQQRKAQIRGQILWLHNGRMECLTRLGQLNWGQLLALVSKTLQRRVLILLHRALGSTKHQRLQQVQLQQLQLQQQQHQHQQEKLQLPEQRQRAARCCQLVLSMELRRQQLRSQLAASKQARSTFSRPPPTQRSSNSQPSPASLEANKPHCCPRNRTTLATTIVEPEMEAPSGPLPRPPPMQQQQQQQPRASRSNLGQCRNLLASSSRCLPAQLAGPQLRPRNPLILL